MSDVHVRRGNASAVVLIGVLIVLHGLVLTGVTIGGTVDTPCGPLLAPRFLPPFDTDQVCGMMHLGTLILVIGLVVGGCAVVVLAARALTGGMNLATAAWVAAAMAVATVVAWALLAWRISTWDTFRPLGWTPVRNLVGFTSIGLVAAAALSLLLAATAGSEPDAKSRG